MSTTKIDYGGPAFALPGIPFYRDGIPQNPFDGYGLAEAPQPGMSLRDWFAGQATEEDIDAHQEYVKDTCGMNPKYTREQAKYRYADAMITARKEAQ